MVERKDLFKIAIKIVKIEFTNFDIKGYGGQGPK